MLDNILSQLLTPLPKFIERCQVTDLGSGSAPKDITIQLPDADGALVPARWTGDPPGLAVNDYVSVRFTPQDPIKYIISGTSSSTAAKVGWPYGNVLTVDTASGGSDYTTLAAAVSAASAGDTILVNSETITITAALSIDKKLLIASIAPNGTKITLATSGTSTISVTTGGSGTILYNLEIENTATGTTAAAVATSQSIDLVRCKVTKTGAATTGYGTWIFTNAVTITLYETTVSVSGPTTGHGVRVDSGSTVNIYGGYISGNTNDVSVNHASAALTLHDPVLANDGANEANGAIAGWYYNANDDHRNAENDGGDLFPSGFGQGIVDRLINQTVTGSEHFNGANSIPSGFSWESTAPFNGTPNTATYNYKNDWAYLLPNDSNRYFMKKTVTSAIIGTFQYMRIATETTVNAGIRIADGTSDNNYYEARMVHTSGPSFAVRVREVIGGVGPTNTNAVVYPVGPSFVIALWALDLGGGSHKPALYLVSEVGSFILAAVGSTHTWTPALAGLVVDANSPAIFDWFQLGE